MGCVGIICGSSVGQVILECQVSPYPKTRLQRPPLCSEESCSEVLMWDDVLTKAEHGGTCL